MTNASQEIIKTFSSVQLSAKWVQILATNRMPASAVKNFAGSAFIHRMSFAPKIKSAERITASNLILAKL